LKREDIIGKKFPPAVIEVDVPQWGKTFIRKISAAERVAIDYLRMENDGRPPNIEARVAVMFVADEAGNRIFKDEDAKELGAEPAHVEAIVAVVNAGLEFNKLRGEPVADAKKNSESIPT
jgi:hypothetical protein